MGKKFASEREPLSSSFNPLAHEFLRLVENVYLNGY